MLLGVLKLGVFFGYRSFYVYFLFVVFHVQSYTGGELQNDRWLHLVNVSKAQWCYRVAMLPVIITYAPAMLSESMYCFYLYLPVCVSFRKKNRKNTGQKLFGRNMNTRSGEILAIVTLAFDLGRVNLLSDA